MHGIFPSRILGCPPPGDLTDSRIETVSPASPALQIDIFSPAEALGKPE